MAVRSGQTVADVGAGTGYFSLPLAETVGLQGKVYAVDAQNEMLALLRQKLDESAIPNVELIHAEAGNTTLRDAVATSSSLQMSGMNSKTAVPY